MAPQRNILLTIKYDGRPFHGWQIQPQVETVQGEIEKGLTRLLGVPTTIDGTGRTDAGVHALGQCATFQTEVPIPVERLAKALTHVLPGGIEIVKAQEVPQGFHARFNAVGKTYLYRLMISQEPELFYRGLFWQLDRMPDVEAMKKAAAHMVGTHDFKCFQAAGGEEKLTTVRTVSDITITSHKVPGSLFGEDHPSLYGKRNLFGGKQGPEEEQLPQPSGEQATLMDIQVTGDGFLYNMVRIMTGTLVAVGYGKLDPEAIPGIIQGKKREAAGPTAPPYGLYLKQVYFQEEQHG